MRRVRTACHVHSEWSYDGRWSLAALAREFARRGYDVVLMAEHDRGFDEDRWQRYRSACARASDEVLLVPGIEYGNADDSVHVAVWGELPFLGEGLATGRLLRRVRELGGAAVLAHPARRAAWEQVEPDWLELLAGVEVWNRKYDGWAPRREATDLLRDDGAMPTAFAGLDFHTDRQLSPLAMVLDAHEPLDEISVVEALVSGRCRGRLAGIPVDLLLRSPGAPVAARAEHLRRILSRARRRPTLRHVEARLRRRSSD